MSILCPQCKSLFVKTGSYCDNCYYGATKAQALSITTKWNDFSEKRIREQQEAKLKDITYTDYHEPSEEQKRIEELEALLQEITKELLEFSSNGKIENICSRIRRVLGE